MARLTTGDVICGRFVVDALVGTGATSEVYRGHDIRLQHRPVAVKLLLTSDHPDTPNLASEEISSLSKLNHPNIAALYDTCTHKGFDVLLMEFVEGTTLAATLGEARLPEREALQCAIQMAEALAHAHQKGLVHRDIKPSNIMMTAHGVKLLDFGLAKVLAAAPSAPASPNEGSVFADGLVGTSFYIPPELLVGKDADARSDIYSFGLVLGQMFTGVQSSLDIQLAKATWISAMLQQVVSRPIRFVIEKCIAFNPDDRWLNAKDLSHALKLVSETMDERPHNAVAPRRFGARSIAAAATIVILSIVIAWFITRGATPAARFQFVVSPPPETQLVSLESGGPPSISPNGQILAFVAADRAGTTRVWTRRLDSLTAVPLSGSEGGTYPFWSPDGRFIAFFAAGRLFRTGATGGELRLLANAPFGRGGSWSRSGEIIFTPGFTDGLYRVPGDGGRAERVTTLELSKHETSHRWPVFLPDGRHFLFFVRSDRPEVQGLFLASLDSPERVRLANISSSAVFASVPGAGDGYLIFQQEGLLFSWRFSPSNGQFLGNPKVLLQTPAPQEDTAVAPLSVSNTGTLVYSGGSVSRQVLTWVDRTGRVMTSTAAEGQYRNPRLSPDRHMLLDERLELRTGLASVWLWELERNVQHKLFSDPGASFSAVWSPDGKQLVYGLYRGERWDLMLRDINGERKPRLLKAGAETGAAQAATDWSKDGRSIIYQEKGPGPMDPWRLGVLDVVDGKARILIDSGQSASQGQLSPDGSWLAYTSTESGKEEIYLRDFPRGQFKFQASANGGAQPRWRDDGRELFFVGPGQEMMSVDVSMRPSTPILGAPHVLFKLRMAPSTGVLTIANYDTDFAAKRFLINEPVALETVHQQISVMVEWGSSLAGAN